MEDLAYLEANEPALARVDMMQSQMCRTRVSEGSDCFRIRCGGSECSRRQMFEKTGMREI